MPNRHLSPQLPAEAPLNFVGPTERFFVGEVSGDQVTIKHWNPFPTEASVQGEVDAFNEDERTNARLEMRPVRRRFVVVHAATVYTVVPAKELV